MPLAGSLRFATLLLVGTLATNAGAESPPPAAPITIEIKAQASEHSRQSFRGTSFGREYIERVQPLSLADPFRHAPGASVQQTTPSQVTIYVRGASGRELGHFVDGVRLNSTIFRAGNNPFIGLLDPYALARVEIRPGANSVRYGSDAIGGAVLMWTFVPSLATAESLLGSRVLQTFVSNPQGGASRGDVTYATQRWAVHLGATRIEAGAIEPGNDELSPLPASYVGARRQAGTGLLPSLVDKQAGTEFQQLAADAAMRLKLPGQLSLIGRAQHSRVTDLVRYDQIVPRFKSELPDRAESRLSPLTRSMAALELAGPDAGSPESTHSLQVSWQRLSERAYFRDLVELCNDSGTAAPCGAASVLARAQERTAESNRADAFGLTGRTRVSLWDALTVSTGATIHHEAVSSSTRIETDGSGTASASARFPDGSTATEVGIHGTPEARLGDFRVAVGGRISLFHVAIAARRGPSSAPASSVTLADWSSQALVDWTPTAGLTVGASWGRALRAPNIQDLATQGTRARGRYQVPNDALEPEHGQSVDIGFRFARSSAFIQATLFYQYSAGAIVLSPTRVGGARVTPDGDEYYTSINASSVRTYGVEAHGRLRLHQLFTPFSRWLAMHGEQSNPTRTGLPPRTPADRIPPIQGEAGFRSELSSTLSLELMTAFRLRQDRLNDPTNLDDNRIPDGGTPGFVTHHIRLGWRARRWLCARLNVDNLADELVLEHGSGFYRPGLAATLMLEVKVDDGAPTQP